MYSILGSRNGRKRLQNWNRRFLAVKRNYLLFFIIRLWEDRKWSRYEKKAKVLAESIGTFNYKHFAERIEDDTYRGYRKVVLRE